MNFIVEAFSLLAILPQLEAIVTKSWGKEDELKGLKSDLAALDHKITAALTPDKDEVEETCQQSNLANKADQAFDSNQSFVAEKAATYGLGINQISPNKCPLVRMISGI